MNNFKPYPKSESLKGYNQKDKDKPKFVEKRPKAKKHKPPGRKKNLQQRMNVVPMMKTRKKFTEEAVEKAVEKFSGLCGNCQSAIPVDPHHIRAKSDMGKGVFTNCLPVCRPCHTEIERNAELRQSWKEWAKREYSVYYWADKYDLWIGGFIKEPDETMRKEFLEKAVKTIDPETFADKSL